MSNASICLTYIVMHNDWLGCRYTINDGDSFIRIKYCSGSGCGCDSCKLCLKKLYHTYACYQVLLRDRLRGLFR